MKNDDVTIHNDILLYSIGFISLHRAATFGIYSLLDMHQDDLSNKFCGEGIPDWAVDTGGEHINMNININVKIIFLLNFPIILSLFQMHVDFLGQSTTRTKWTQTQDIQLTR